MRVFLERAVVTILAVVIATYAGDWLVYRYHVARGAAFDSVLVNQFIAVPLKGGKYEMDYVGSQQTACVRTIFPWAGDDPCWWLRRHTDKGTQP